MLKGVVGHGVIVYIGFHGKHYPAVVMIVNYHIIIDNEAEDALMCMLIIPELDLIYTPRTQVYT